MRTDKIFPYVVPDGYVRGLAVGPSELVRPMPNDVFTILVEDLDGICGNITPEDARGSGKSTDELYRIALDNLTTLARSQVVRFGLASGPRGLPFVVCTGHWLSASCILLEDLFRKVSGTLQSGALLASIPVRESLLIFRDVDADYRREMQALIDAAEEGQRKPITRRLFGFGPNGLSTAGDD
jgi:hypothetical protein